jgi:hypothetical protein
MLIKSIFLIRIVYFIDVVSAPAFILFILRNKEQELMQPQ